MREILFKAKKKDNGEWVEGFYVANPCNVYIIPDDWEISIELDSIEVVPETVCEYVGDYDENKEKLFENDIVELYFKDYYSNDNFTIVEDTKLIGQIVFKNFMFMVEFKDKSYIMLAELDWEEIEIRRLGNKFDNPELLKGDNNG